MTCPMTGHVTEEYDEGQRAAVWAVVQTLPRKARAVVVLRYYEQLSEAETAEALGISVGTVKSQASRALADPARTHPTPEPPQPRGGAMNTTDDLTRSLREQADRIGGHPIDLDVRPRHGPQHPAATGGLPPGPASWLRWRCSRRSR